MPGACVSGAAQQASLLLRVCDERGDRSGIVQRENSNTDKSDTCYVVQVFGIDVFREQAASQHADG